MPRFAIGNLTIDLDIPQRFVCEYAPGGSLVAFDESTGALAEVSALWLERHTGEDGRAGLEAVRSDAAEAKIALHRDGADFASYFEPPCTWHGGFGHHHIIATLTNGEAFPEFADVLASVEPAHNPFPADQDIAISDLRPSHALWFEQHRTSLIDMFNWSAEHHGSAEGLDDLWAETLEDPPEDPQVLEGALTLIALAFGELLRPLGFEWCVAKDPYGTTIAMVALRGTASIVVVPDSIVSKRWESREPSFVVAVLAGMADHVEEMKADWAEPGS